MEPSYCLGESSLGSRDLGARSEHSEPQCLDEFEVSADGKVRVKGCSEHQVLGAIVPENGGASEVEVHSKASGQRKASRGVCLLEVAQSRKRSSPAWKESSLKASLSAKLGKHIKGCLAIS